MHLKPLLLVCTETILDTAPDLTASSVVTMRDMERPLPRSGTGARVECLLHRARTGLMNGVASMADMKKTGAFLLSITTELTI